MITHTRVESLTMPHQQGFIGMEVKAMTQVEQGMAKAMTYNTTVPQFYLMEDLIMTNLMKLRARLNEGKSKEEKIKQSQNILHMLKSTMLQHILELMIDIFNTFKTMIPA